MLHAKKRDMIIAVLLKVLLVHFVSNKIIVLVENKLIKFVIDLHANKIVFSAYLFNFFKTHSSAKYSFTLKLLFVILQSTSYCNSLISLSFLYYDFFLEPRHQPQSSSFKN